MVRYYFDTKVGDTTIADSEGADVSTLDQAKDMAVQALPGMLRDSMSSGSREPVSVRVRDESGAFCFKAILSLEMVMA